LAEDGYDVELVDPVPHHVLSARSVGGFRCREGDARDLVETENSVDVVLLLGPLYHLTDLTDRVAALSEAHRVLRPGGLLAAAAISRYLGVLEIAGRSELNAEELDLEAQVLASGSYAPVLGFTHSHWHLPDELRDEVGRAGFKDVRVVGIEGPQWTVLDALGIEAFDQHLAGAVAIAELLEADPLVMAMSAHLLALATK
jgi:SAM-dependent methyltransferase